MTGDELVRMMQMAGIKSPELAQLMGYKTPWRIYAARAKQSGRIIVAIDRALEKYMSPKHYKSALEEIRGVTKAQKLNRVSIEKGISLPSQVRRDLAAVSAARNVWIHVSREKIEPPMQEAASDECRLLGGEDSKDLGKLATTTNNLET